MKGFPIDGATGGLFNFVALIVLIRAMGCVHVSQKTNKL
jgi:hypothetical protein